MPFKSFRHGLAAVAFACAMGGGIAHAAPMLKFDQQWTQIGAGAEIVAIDVPSGRVFTTTGGSVEIRRISDGALLGSFTVPGAGGINSVAVGNGVVAIAAEGAGGAQDIGKVAFFNTTAAPGSAPTAVVNAGYLPDMVTFTPDGNTVLVANEGEPSDDYSNDPEGSVSIIDISGGIAGV
ncbi:MAG: hypothetical protein V2J89_05025, partial [Halieaceae bacterium]|nr:hypothetical protein [Halieaceae bacterium]